MQDGPRAPDPSPAAAPRPREDARARTPVDGDERYRQLFESNPLPMWIYDLETLRFLDVNEVACARYGWSRDEFLAMSILDIRPPEDAPAVQDSVRDTPASVFSSGVWRHRLKNGEIILVEIRSHEMTFMGRHGRFVCPIDVTQRMNDAARLARHAEELEERVRQRTAELLVSNRELAQATAQAQQASIAKSRFLSTVSHELRTPLNAILGFAQLLTLNRDQALAASQQASYGQHIVDAGKHLLDLINELLDLAAIEAGKTALAIEALELGAVLGDCVALIRPIAEPRGIALRTFDDRTVRVMSDRTRLKQVLINLLSNAVKYSPEDAVVDVACQHLGDNVRLSVIDHGAGMTPQQVDALYQPFNRLGREAGATQGSGIGLVVSKGLVELMGGRIGVDSVPGVGSTFWIELPASAERPAAVPVLDAAAPAASTGPGAAAPDVTVLCVDDDLLSLRLLENVLAMRPGVQVLTASNGRIGVELARRHLPTVIVMDNNMPEMTGREARELLRADPSTAAIPIIALSANVTGTPGAVAGVEGVFRAIPKPFEVGPVLEAIEDAVKAARRRPG
ncbi:MAG: response regulator [Burkholderiales bacterium]|nr:response regulator [Burkholderiales bacterium]